MLHVFHFFFSPVVACMLKINFVITFVTYLYIVSIFVPKVRWMWVVVKGQM